MNGVLPINITNLGQQTNGSKKFCLDKYNRIEFELPEDFLNFDSVLIDQSVFVAPTKSKFVSELEPWYQLSVQLYGLDASEQWVRILYINANCLIE